MATRDYLVKLGIPTARFVAVSLGEEGPVAVGASELVWSKNRRSEFRKALQN